MSGMAVIDVRPRIEFDAGHFVGAVSMPLDELREQRAGIPASGAAVYCGAEFCRMARAAAAFLRECGVDAAAMAEGIVEWRAAGEYDLDDIA